MNINALYSIFVSSTGVTTDSRNCPVDSLFFALKGESFDGNIYAETSLENGCAFTVVDDSSVVKDDRFILVDDVLETLQKLANYHRKTLATPVIGITGSNGKTTTKELLAIVLSQKYNLHFTQGNFNNHIGVPLTLLQLKAEHDMAVVEMGANHPGEIGELCAIVEPDMGIITNIGKAHLEGFGGIEGVIKTKKELYDFIRINGGQLFVNGGDELLVSISEGIDQVCYNDNKSLFCVSVVDAVPTLKLSVANKFKTLQLQTQMVGEYNWINVAAVLEIGASLGVNFDEMKEALEAYAPSNNRSQILETGRNRVLLDAYNANPASMAVAVDNFIKLEASSKAVILGAMKELGDYSVEEHQVLVDVVSRADFKVKIFVGQEFEAAQIQQDNMLFLLSIDDAKSYLKDNSLNNATVLIKGSRSMQMENLVELL